MTDQAKEAEDAKIKLLERMFEEGSVSWDQMKKIAGFRDKELQELIENGLIEADGSYFGGSKHYFPTKKARKYLAERGVRIYVQTPGGAPLKNEKHDEVLRNLRLKFEDMGHKTWQSERCLRQRGMVEVTPDGILELGRRKIAFELELSSKTIKQYGERFEFYEKHPAIDAVLYFVATPNQREKLLELSKGCRKIYVTLLKNFSEHEGKAYVEHSGFPGAIQLWKFLEVINRKRFIAVGDLQAGTCER